MKTHSFGDYTFVPAAVFPSVASASGGRSWDYVIVTTKALPDRTDDAALIAPLVGQDTCIVLIQNGVGVEHPYRQRFPENPIVSAVTVVSAEQVSLGTIRQNRWTRIHLGPYTNSASFERAAEPTGAGDLHSRGVSCTAALAQWWGELGGIRDAEPDDEVGLQTVRWHKLCINAAFNPSAVLSGGRGNADMVRDPELREHLAGVMREIWDAAPKILGRPFPKDLAGPEKILKSTERNVGAKPSMLLDWQANRPLELEVILGNPVRIARAKGVQMPRLQTLYALLKSAQAVRSGQQDAIKQSREAKI
jgi:2-dehydropantoate 2-reductase